MTTRIRPSAYLPCLVALFVLAWLGATTVPVRTAQSDLDALMTRALARRDTSWKALPQFVLDERSEAEVVGPTGARILAERRDYAWFPRDGVFVRSPLRVNGRTVSEAERRTEEADFITRERRRDERRRKNESAREDAAGAPAGDDTAEALAAAVRPYFLVNNSFLLDLKHEPGRYGLVGRETLNGREVVKVEYYPTALFQSGRARPNRRARERDERITERVNKAVLVTLWIDPAISQIVRYELDDVDLGFLPGQWLVRITEGRTTMTLSEVLPDVWLPTVAETMVRMQSPAGPVEGRWRLTYTNHKRADVGTRLVK